MSLYALRPRRVHAWRLDWSNWQELADKTKGQFHQSLVLGRGAVQTMRHHMPNQGRAYLSIPVEGGKYEVCKIGDYVVEETDGTYSAWNQSDFEETFEALSYAEALNGEIIVLATGSGLDPVLRMKGSDH